MSKLIAPAPKPSPRLNDARSTGALRPVRPSDILALRGTLKGRP
jgi:hypothetical protein